ncbi:hypothetical protein SADUNF_Sadunf08G0017100 [Salix dunnii]|uniref:RING-type domain-containing protein n=1 Tax=Salix dunnii TaxID=1413687 RepID=A0A835MX14_9ROSI|nr:hypothetical protein SADUNF_Sadunf08G0017100 [Salix dunnii]
MIASGINLVMTVIGFAVSTMFIVFVCTRLLCARIQLNASRRAFPIASRSNLSLLERGGLEYVVVANFPTKKYNDKIFSASEDAHIIHQFNLGDNNLCDFHEEVKTEAWARGIIEKGVTLLDVEPQFSKRQFCSSEVKGIKLVLIGFLMDLCTVCLAEYHGEDILRILPYCGHSFHVTCIDIWLQQHSTCPVCRMSLREFPEKKRAMQPLFSSATRSQYGTETFDSHSYNYMLTERGISPRSYSNHGMDPLQDNHCAFDGDEAEGGENSTPLSESNQIAEDIADKHVESLSNP